MPTQPPCVRDCGPCPSPSPIWCCRSGRTSRWPMLRMLPGTVTTARLEHDFWEEVFVMRGDYEAYDPATGLATVSFADGGGYACRPPGKPHGPFRTKGGALLFEIQYYGEAAGT